MLESLSRVWVWSVTPLEKNNISSPCRDQLDIISWLGMGLCVQFPLSVLGNCADLSQSLWVPVAILPVVSGRCVSLESSPTPASYNLSASSSTLISQHWGRSFMPMGGHCPIRRHVLPLNPSVQGACYILWAIGHRGPTDTLKYCRLLPMVLLTSTTWQQGPAVEGTVYIGHQTWEHGEIELVFN